MGDKMEAETMAVVEKAENLYFQPGLYFEFFI